MNFISSICKLPAINLAGIIPPFVIARITSYFLDDLFILLARVSTSISTSPHNILLVNFRLLLSVLYSTLRSNCDIRKGTTLINDPMFTDVLVMLG